MTVPITGFYLVQQSDTEGKIVRLEAGDIIDSEALFQFAGEADVKTLLEQE